MDHYCLGKPIYIYIAGPYTHGDVAENVRKAIDAAEWLAEHGYTPYVPHLSHLWHLVHPHVIRFWYELDMEWLKKCDVLLRLPGESEGADKEVELARELGLKVYIKRGDYLFEEAF